MLIDVSPSYQPSIDWTAVAAAGVIGAWLKATEGNTWPDPGTPEASWLSAQQPAATAARILTGCYHLARPDLHPGPAGAAAEAQHYLAKTSAGPGHLGDALDLEPANVGHLSGPALAEWVRAFCQPVEAARGGQVTLYMARDTLSQLGDGYPGPRPLWLAWPGWTGQQVPAQTVLVQTGQQQVPGIPGATDVDVPATAGAPPAPQAPGSPQAAPTAPTTTIPTQEVPQVHIVDLRAAQTTPVRGPGVRPLQVLLQLVGHYAGHIDGIGGPLTRTGLLTYQSAARLQADGIAGPLTFSALDSTQ